MSAPPVRDSTLSKGTIMNTVASVPRRILSVLAFVAFHLLAALFVLLYVLIAAVVALVRWCVEVFRRSARRPHRPAVGAS
ncbi:hypothetical protein ACTU3I_12640 [Microbacterium sp. RD1]|uniref:hypothetical protein n=1 Tax=Microbacterium sp. RD1 TaxID=3457313 RepID=UPI003FA5BE29